MASALWYLVREIAPKSHRVGPSKQVAITQALLTFTDTFMTIRDGAVTS